MVSTIKLSGESAAIPDANEANIPDVNTSGKGPQPAKNCNKRKKTHAKDTDEPSTSAATSASASSNAAETNTETRKTLVREQMLDFEDPDSKIHIPQYMYMPAPTKLKMEELRKHAIIADIEKSKQMANFFRRCTGVLGPLKDYLLSQPKLKPAESGEHGYASTQLQMMMTIQS